MINGAATPEGTIAYAEKFGKMVYQKLGRTGCWVSQAGFGGYRVSTGIHEHLDSLVQALSKGINVIDTSANYTDGGSETLVGQVLDKLINKGHISREQIVVVTKAGYLQGQNYQLSQKRKEQGEPFPDLVLYEKDLEHCIHPDFLDDQLTRSLNRMQLRALDVFLLHNPEYYLAWAAQQGMQLDKARETFYRRIESAFQFLERAVMDGKIRCYGISSNSFATAVDDSEFVNLTRIWEIAQSMSPDHHFHVIQMPINLFESAAVLNLNQPAGQSVLQFAQNKHLGVITNRPLNAFADNRFIRLAEVKTIARYSDADIIHAINGLIKSEKKLWRKLLPSLQLPGPLYLRIKDQAAMGDHFKHYWRNFGTYERWRQFRDGFVWPRMQGVFEYLQQQAMQMTVIDQWLTDHQHYLASACRAVESLYVDAAVRKIADIKRSIVSADPQWATPGTLSQLAIRALRSTFGITTVLVGMRKPHYVVDMIKELEVSIPVSDRTASWHNLRKQLVHGDAQT